MSETAPNRTLEQLFSPLASPVDYDFYCDEVFKQWEAEQDPEVINMKAQDLLALALRHPHFSQNERLHAFVFVSDLTMERLRQYSKQPTGQPDVIKQAELIHMTYAQVYAQSMVELAKSVQLDPAFPQP